jgi:hypothetical protein
MSEDGETAMTRLEHRTINPPASRRPQPSGAQTVIVVIVIVAVWAALVAIGAPPEATAAGLGAAARVALYVAARLAKSAPAPRRARRNPRTEATRA